MTQTSRRSGFHLEAQVRPAEVRDLSAGVRARGPWLPLLSAFVLVL